MDRPVDEVKTNEELHRCFPVHIMHKGRTQTHRYPWSIAEKATREWKLCFFLFQIKTNARRASTRVKRLFSLSRSKSTSSLSGTISDNKKSSVSPQQKPEDQDQNVKNINIPKQGSDDQDNNNKYLACKQLSTSEKQDDLNAMTSELQRKAPNEPNNEEDRAYDANGPKQHVSDTRF